MDEKKYQLIVFKFQYTDDITCLWPVYIDVSPENLAGKEDKDLFTDVINELESYPLISKVKIIHNKLADLNECRETFNSILGNQAGDNSIRLKYLKLEKQTVLKDEPVEDYKTNKAYAIIRTQAISYPVRLRAEKYPFLLDDIELPLVVITKSAV